MADKKNVQDVDSGEVIVAKAKDFWEKNSKLLMIASVVIILVVGGWYGYQNFIVKPKETKAAEVMFKAEEYFRTDSIQLALNGDGQNWGFLRVIDKYGGTDAGKLARFYAGACYIKLNENQKAIDQLKKFSTSSKPVQARAYKLMADAYADLGKNKDAFDYYKKAGSLYADDNLISPLYLFRGALLYQDLGKNKEAIELLKQIKDKYPQSQQAGEADKYLGKLGDTQ